jgi:hypothetical protein
VSARKSAVPGSGVDPLLKRLRKLKASQLLEAEQALELPVTRWREANVGQLYPVVVGALTGRPASDFGDETLEDLDRMIDELTGEGAADPNERRAGS